MFANPQQVVNSTSSRNKPFVIRGLPCDYAVMAGQSTPFESFGGCTTRGETQLAWDSVQRACDLALVALTMPVWGPLLLGAVAVKFLFDGGPILFRHVRLGLGGRPFVLYKIRTTPADFRPSPADWSNQDYPPRTRYGAFLRHFDLDELPQLWNVIKGEMSLVGPRPEMPFHVKRFSRWLPEYRQRLEVRPGLTGLAQVRGWRGDTSIQQRLLADLEYTNRRGARMYFVILARTLISGSARHPQPVSGR
jgi:lipopolysaccharide/colanic/teichoic acid biosynthesis glycosyltransferase